MACAFWLVDVYMLRLRTFRRIVHCRREANMSAVWDHPIDVYGRRLIELLKNLGLIFLNGRVKGDRQGEFTTTHNSVIDYCIGSPDVIEYIDSLKIEDYDNNIIFSDVHSSL